jgi:hypothetical protein
MRTQKRPVNFTRGEECQGGEMRRRIADCRDRLRRNRAARRIIERATPLDEKMAAEETACAAASAAPEGREGEF